MQTIQTEGGSEKATTARIDMLQAYIGTALDVIGRAGFNYYFNSHKTQENPLAKAFNHMINANLENKMVAMIQQVFPGAFNWVGCLCYAMCLHSSRLRTRGPSLSHARFLTTLERYEHLHDSSNHQGIVRDRKAEIARDHISLDKNDYEGKDVISLCLRANMLASERDRMTDDEVLGQIGTLVSKSSYYPLTARCLPVTRLPLRLSAGPRTTLSSARTFRPVSARSSCP